MRTSIQIKKEIKKRKTYLEEYVNPEYIGGVKASREFNQEQDIELQKLQALLQQNQEIINEIDENIEECKRFCFCKGLIKEGLSSQKVCANCHSRDMLQELKQSITGEEK